MNRHERAAILKPLVDRLCVSHCWVRGKNGPRHVNEPFTAVSLSEHCAGTRVFGLCPIAPGESTCRVAVLDLDSHKGEVEWPSMVAVANRIAVTLECDGYHPVQFRSSGGQGIHIYLVWPVDEPQDAHSVRGYLRGVLAQCGLTEGAGGLVKGQVEVFPKQDEVPADGVGSMVILPLSPATKSEIL